MGPARTSLVRNIPLQLREGVEGKNRGEIGWEVLTLLICPSRTLGRFFPPTLQLTSFTSSPNLATRGYSRQHIQMWAPALSST